VLTAVWGGGSSNKHQIIPGVENLRLTEHAVTRRTQVISSDMHTQPKSELECVVGSHCSSTSKQICISDAAHLAFVVRIVLATSQ
jgi:hypothetical protein